MPTFKIRGQLDSVVCSVAQPLSGSLVIEECSATIRSIELQLVRVETCGYQDGMAREATEIQNIQIADGPVCHGWEIPIHMIFPRLFTCPTVSTKTFKVDFEVNLVILFSDGHLLTENFPLKLVRHSGAPPPPPQLADEGAADPLGGGGGDDSSARAAPRAAAAPPPRASAVEAVPALPVPDDPLAALLDAPAPAPAPAARAAVAAPAVPPDVSDAPASAPEGDSDPLGVGDPLSELLK